MSDKTCPNCQSTFTCAIQNGNTVCWCFDLPHVIPLDQIGTDNQNSTDCLCRQCLQELINASNPSQFRHIMLIRQD